MVSAKKSMTKKSIGKNAILNIIKQCCNILFPLIVYPYISRTIGAENLGKYSFSESVLQYAILFSGLGISTYAVREGSRIRDDKNQIQKFSNEIFSINLICTAITYFFYFLFIALIPKFYENRILLFIMGIDIIATTLSRDWINTIYEDFAYVTLRFIICQSLSVICTFIFVRQSSDYILYTIIVVAAVSSGYLFSTFYTRKHVKVQITYNLNIRKHLKPVLVLFANSFAQSIYISVDIIMLGFLCTDKEVGIYSLSSKIYAIIKALLVAAIMVTIPRISNYIGKDNEEGQNKIMIDLRDSLYTFVFPCVTGLLFLSKEVVTLVGGNAYSRGSESLSILCFALVFAVFGTYYAQAYLITHRMEKQMLLSTTVSAIVNIALNLLFIPLWGIEGAAYTTLISEFLNFMICGVYVDPQIRKISRSVFSPAIGCIVIAFNCLIITRYVELNSIKIVLSICFSVISYIIIQLIGKNRIVYLYVDRIAERMGRK